MSKITYPANSAYHTTPQLSWRIGNFVYRPITPDPGDQPYTLTQRHQYRPDRLSYDLFGSPSYFWVFSVRNPFLRANPIWDFVAGLEIMVPTRDYLSRVLGG